VNEIDPAEVLAEAERLKDAGDFESALQRHLWIHHESLGVCPAFRGVRLSFALMYWRELGEVFPPALVAMRRVRDENLAAIQSGDSVGQNYLDALALNRELGDHSQNVEMLETLEVADPPRAEKLFPFLFDSLVSAKAWKTARRFIPDPHVKLTEFLSDLERVLAEFPQTTEPLPLRRRGAIFGFSRNLRMLLEVLDGNGEQRLAGEVRENALVGISCEFAKSEVEHGLSEAGSNE